MIRNLTTRLIIILIIIAVSLWIDLSDNMTIRNPFNSKVLFQRNVTPRLGLDLRGGLQVLLEADLPADARVDADALQVARTIIENRTNAYGVAETVIQVAGDRRIVGEFPGISDSDTESVIATLQQTGLLEFVDTGSEFIQAGTVLQTDFAQGSSTVPTPEPSPTPTNGSDTANEPKIYHTIMTGKVLKTVFVSTDNLGQYVIEFTLMNEGKDIFAEHTASHIDQYLTIVLDKKVISSPVIQSAIPDGQGIIQGSFTSESANALAIQLRYGSLPIPLKIVETRIVGPTLGEDSLQRSLIAGLIGISIVLMFMLLYYRLPGLVANISIIIYALIAFALFKYIPVTLSLPGIAGFLLSTGAALDANILIFERLKEELRNGRNLTQAIDHGWTRAWPSIRDSNIATIITSAILFWFGSTFGATIVKGFSLTLALGVAISLFTAIFVTRSLLALILGALKPTNFARWFGI